MSKTIEILDTAIHPDGSCTITAMDVSEERLDRISRQSSYEEYSGEESYVFEDSKAFCSLKRFLNNQKVIQDNHPRTWGEALRLIEGTIISSYGIGKYRVREW